MFRRQNIDREFWSRKSTLREIDLAVEATGEDIQPGSGDLGLLWRGCDGSSDESKWEAFYGGDTNQRREVRWLLGV